MREAGRGRNVSIDRRTGTVRRRAGRVRDTCRGTQQQGADNVRHDDGKRADRRRLPRRRHRHPTTNFRDDHGARGLTQLRQFPYDAELRSRIDARRFPEITAELRTITPLSPGRFRVTGALTIQGTTRELSGGLELSLSADGTARVTGCQTIDIRDFAIDLPTMLMLRIFPDVTVRFHIKAVRASQDQETGEQP